MINSCTQHIFDEVTFAVSLGHVLYMLKNTIILLFYLPLPFDFVSGSPAVGGDREEDMAAADGASDYETESQNPKKISERMLSWQMKYGQSEEVGAPKYDKEVPHSHIPLLTGGKEVIQSAWQMMFSLPSSSGQNKFTFSLSIIKWVLKSILGLWRVISCLT